MPQVPTDLRHLDRPVLRLRGPQSGLVGYLPVAEFDRAPLSPAISPLSTAFAVMRDTLLGGPQGTPLACRQSVKSNLRARDVDAFAPLTDAAITGWPTLLDWHQAPVGTLDQALQYVAATPGTALLAALESDRDVTPAKAWDPLRRDPDRWLAGYVDALRRGWRGFAPLWRRSSALLEREVERIDAARDRGVAPSEIINLLGTGAARVECMPRSAGGACRRLSVDERGVTLVPMISGARSCIIASPEDYFVRLAYPLHDVWRVFQGDAPPPASLDALLGAQRSVLLRRLDRPRTAGQLAELLHLTPSAVTFHLRSLEAAGLVVRERRGRHVIVSRSSRGTDLLALYESP